MIRLGSGGYVCLPALLCLATLPHVPTADFDKAFEEVSELAGTFKANEGFYLSNEYQEAEARKDFIDKLFMALGWDVNHNKQRNPYEQEVKVEPSIAEGSARKRADYAFFLAPNFHDVNFFVEAKKPSGDLGNADNIFQTVRYGWSSRTPIAALTNFDRFYVLDCRREPNIGDTLSRIAKRFNRDDYTDKGRFAELYYLFAHEEIAKRSLLKFADSLPRAKPKIYRRGLFTSRGGEMDDTFLEELDDYRGKLAKVFKQQHPQLTSAALTEMTQRTLDRLVFTRFLEDKLIEPAAHVEKFAKSDTPWKDFIERSVLLNRTYNGIVYKPHELLDNERFLTDDHVFQKICEGLGDPTSPYNFNHIPIPILGSIYERFLGNVISDAGRLTEKPEVRKAGGVYYTPEYIVRYIVENTVGKLIMDKTPKQIAAMKFADIACGSGSFLLGVYDTLLRYHTKYYSDKPATMRPGDCVRKDDGAWHLTLAKKREILVNNIYGVDLDAQAVEVCQLSLYLKLLEEETTESAQKFLDFEHRTQIKQLLPDLSKNIVRGNSLIGRDITKTHKLTPDEEMKLCPMDFESRFPDIMKRGGFDAIVGNPPWGIEFSKTEQPYIRDNYDTGRAGTIDSYALFVERALAGLKAEGRLGYIIPDTFLRKDDYLALRKLFLTRTRIRELIETGPVFSQVRDTWCLVFSVENEKPSAKHMIRHRKISRFIVSTEERLEHFEKGHWDQESTVPQSLWMKHPKMIIGYLASIPAQDLIAKIEAHPKLGELSERFQISRGEEGSKFALKPSANGDFFIVIPENIERYSVADGMRLSRRTLTRTKVKALYQHPKIWIIRIQKLRWKQRLVCGFDSRTNSAGMKTLQVIVSRTDNTADLKYLLAILASPLTNFWCINYLADDMNQSYLEKLPIRLPDFSKPADKTGHDEVVRLVDEMLAAKQQQAAALMDADKDFWEQKCADLDTKIDKLVYDLYGLTDSEIEIVEGV